MMKIDPEKLSLVAFAILQMAQYGGMPEQRAKQIHDELKECWEQIDDKPEALAWLQDTMDKIARVG